MIYIGIISSLTFLLDIAESNVNLLNPSFTNYMLLKY